MSGRPRLLVIGATGFVGGHLVRAAHERFECIPAGRSDSGRRLEITDAGSVRTAFDEACPDVVALAAAMADIDLCEREPAEARRTNEEGVRNVASECARTGARLIFASSGAVFDGRRAEYREEDAACPVSVYGATKAEAERMVQSLVPNSAVVRLSLVLGWPLRDGTNALLGRLRRAFSAREPVLASTAECRNAIDIATAAKWMLDLAADSEARGIFHLGSSDALSRFDIVRALADAMGYPPEFVVAEHQPRPGRAPRGLHEFLVPGRIGQFSSVPVPTCRKAVERCVHAIA